VNVPNQMVKEILGGLPQFKGEIIVGSPTALDCHERSMAFINDASAIFLFVFWVYDIRTTGMFDLRKRLDIAESFVNTCNMNIQFVDHTLIESQEELDKYVELVVTERGFPGVILREPFGTFGHEDEEVSLPYPTRTLA
jgi:hypothetical protein